MGFYTLAVGSLELDFYAGSDDRARAIGARWLRLFWSRYKASRRAGGMAHAWCRDAEFVSLHRAHVDSAGIIANTRPRIDRWHLECNGEIARRYK